MDKDLYDLPKEESEQIPTVASSFEMALEALKEDHAFLIEGGVFTKDMIEAFIELKEQEAIRVAMETHPAEFDMYYSC